MPGGLFFTIGTSGALGKSRDKDLSKYDELDQEWRAIGLAAPARRALVDAKLYKVSDLRKISLQDLTNLHGMGKSAIARIKVVMHGQKIAFRN